MTNQNNQGQQNQQGNKLGQGGQQGQRDKPGQQTQNPVRAANEVVRAKPNPKERRPASAGRSFHTLPIARAKSTLLGEKKGGFEPNDLLPPN